MRRIEGNGVTAVTGDTRERGVDRGEKKKKEKKIIGSKAIILWRLI